MSAQQLTREGVQSAYNLVMDNVHRRAFFHKLAQLRPQYMPQTEEDANYLTELGLKLAVASQDADSQSIGKQAEYSPFGAALSDLDGVLGIKQAGNDIQDAAFGMAEDPSIYDAVVTLKTAEALSR